MDKTEERLNLDFRVLMLFFYLTKREVIIIEQVIKMLPKYRVKQKRKNTKKTQEEYIEELSIKNPNLIVLDQYINAHTKIRHQYKNCGHIANIAPTLALQGFGCNICTRSKIGDRFRITEEEYLNRVSTDNPTILVKSQYKGMNERIDLECLICGTSWSPFAGSIVGKNISGCPECWKNKNAVSRSLGLEEYKKRVQVINPSIEILSDYYVNTTTPLRHKCMICNFIWDAMPCNILSEHGCPNCANNIKKSFKEVVEEIEDINPDVIVIGPYISSNSPLYCQCKLCGCFWHSSFSRLKRGRGCPICSLSKGEREVKRVLDKYGVLYEQQKEFDGLLGIGNGLLSYDFYLKSNNTLIEYQGNFHDGTVKGNFQTQKQFEIQQEHDRRKRQYAKEHNINLLEIWYYDYDNIEQILSDYLNLNSESVTTVEVA